MKADERMFQNEPLEFLYVSVITRKRTCPEAFDQSQTGAESSSYA